MIKITGLKAGAGRRRQVGQAGQAQPGRAGAGRQGRHRQVGQAQAGAGKRRQVGQVQAGKAGSNSCNSTLFS